MTGNQFKAARALVGMEQVVLAEKAGLSVNTIRNMEATGAAVMRIRLDTLHKAKAALESAGVEFIAENDGGPGVRLRRKHGEDNP